MTKLVTYTISCKKCGWVIDHTDYSLAIIKKYHKEWNEKYKNGMNCVHNYTFTLKEISHND